MYLRNDNSETKRQSQDTKTRHKNDKTTALQKSDNGFKKLQKLNKTIDY